MSNDRATFSHPSADTDRQILGERLKEAREYVGLKQEDVAKKLGIPRSALSNIEAGSRKVDAIELAQLAKLYQRPVAWFTGKIRTAHLTRCRKRSLTSRAPRQHSLSRIERSLRVLRIS